MESPESEPPYLSPKDGEGNLHDPVEWWDVQTAMIKTFTFEGEAHIYAARLRESGVRCFNPASISPVRRRISAIFICWAGV